MAGAPPFTVQLTCQGRGPSLHPELAPVLALLAWLAGPDAVRLEVEALWLPDLGPALVLLLPPEGPDALAEDAADPPDPAPPPDDDDELESPSGPGQPVPPSSAQVTATVTHFHGHGMHAPPVSNADL